MGKTSRAPQAETETAPGPVEQAPASQPISFAEPAAQLADGAVVSDAKPEGFVDPVIDPSLLRKLQNEADQENKKRDFYQKLMAARTPPPEPVFVPPPLAPQVAAQTAAELEAGRARVAEHEAQQARHRPPAPPDPREGSNKPVFRPSDYVPDQKKGQGYTQAQPLNT